MNSIKILIFGTTFQILFLFSGLVKAQSTEVQQLLLNVEKLSQLKNILTDMKKGFSVISGGYDAIKNISKGNFTLHEVFMDGLLLVRPEVKKYRRVADIITYQKKIVTEYKLAYDRFRSAGNFNLSELDYFAKVYQQLFDQNLNNLDALVMVTTSLTLRMSDEQRLQAIDRIFADTEDKLMFLRSFNAQANLLSAYRDKEKQQIRDSRSFYNIN
ncbi:TerB family tellurite resistance protein [Pedobacter sp. N36a]|uniref:TerB family tellurite resistance protein n=1 Tax=Pedobacter sp. N36a TaxID=2767996 RepID=UPI0016571D1D|nr:TerB family tellurite resistance protein [Pedobacter sp. N36a]MBC8986666.1 TerB family tellurite resistance protein [Pedobacter sp. N36a]